MLVVGFMKILVNILVVKSSIPLPLLCQFNCSCSTDAVTADDVQRVAENMLKSRPALAVLGDLKRIPSLKDIDEALLPANKGVLRRTSRLLFPGL